MALTESQRTEISKKIVSIPAENAQADELIVDLEAARVKAVDKDNGNKDIMDDKTELIDDYENELERLDSDERTHLTESHIQDSADKILGNFFYNNDQSIPTPACPLGVWANFVPNGYNVAVGKNYNETYGTVQKEQDLIDVVNTEIANMEAESGVGRSTGQECVGASVGFCTPTATPDTEVQCGIEGGVWTPPTPDTIQNDPAIQTISTNLKAAVQAWEDFMNITDGVICTIDTDPTRSSENIAARADITNAISVIDTWQALGDFDTTHGQTTCAGFNAIDPLTLDPTKYRAAELDTLKAEITARQSFLTTRIAQVVAYLGSVTQDSGGIITAADGLYGDRFRIVDLRLNLMSGSLSEAKGYEQGKNAQNELKASNVNAELAYDGVMKAILFMAPAAGTGTIHVMSAVDFSATDSVYICAEDQSEIAATIDSIDGNIIYLSVDIPKKYRQDALARMYKVI